jgi:type VI protein secretion system component VasF
MTFIASLMGLRAIIARYFDSRWLERALDGLYYILPKVSELGSLARLLSDSPEARVTAWMPLWSSGLFGAACLMTAGWLLHRKDF